MNSRFMILGLVIAIIFTVSITESIQIVDGFLTVATDLVFEMQRGETKMLTWTIINNGAEPLYLEMFAEKPGSELYIFEEDITIEAGETRDVEIFVLVPEDHPDNRIYYTEVYVKEVTTHGDAEEKGGGKINIVIQQRTKPIIKIGDNPVQYIPEIIKEKTKDIPETITPKSSVKVEEEIVGETMKEKLERIKAANEANKSDEVTSLPQMKVTEKINDDQMMDEEPRMDEEPSVQNVIQEEEGGGCLIATAAFGTEMAPQVQLLREIRDNQLMNSNSGLIFMTGFNQMYYSFSPIIADMERENPIFREMIKLSITPMLSTLSIMEHADSESKVLGLGIGVILMNLGMYVGLPTFGIVKLIQFRKN